MIIIGIIISLLLFTTIVLIHELGHFSMSRLFGVKVEEFGLGIPPKAKELFTDKKGTTYTLNWLPLGGFVRLKGESLENLNNKNDKDALINKPTWQQIIIILAGVVMNFILATIIFSILFFIGVKPIGVNTKIETNLDIKLIPTYEQALESGLLLKKSGIILYPVEGSIISNNADKEIELKIQSTTTPSSQKEKAEVILIKITPGLDGKIGAYLSENISINENFEYKYSLGESIKNGFKETYYESLLTLKGINLLVKNIFNPDTPQEREEAINNVAGPIGLVNFISSSLSAGLIYFLIIGAIISINLGVFNLLPIPALDGGRFIFILINSIFRRIIGKKAINENVEGFIHVIFFILLIALSLIIAYNDISKIISN